MKCFVISLKHSEDRRKFCEPKLKEAKLDYEFFAATYGQELTSSQLQQCSQDKENIFDLGQGLLGKVQIKLAKALTLNEIGCAFSHLRLYQHILDLDLDYALILEDDCIVNPQLLSALNAIEQGCIKEPWDIISFSKHLGIKNCPLAKKYYFNFEDGIDSEPKQAYFKREGMGSSLLDVTFNARRLIGAAVGYIVSKQACKHLIELGYPIRMPADYLTGLIAFNKLKFFRVYPLETFINYDTKNSCIGYREEQKIIRL